MSVNIYDDTQGTLTRCDGVPATQYIIVSQTVSIPAGESLTVDVSSRIPSGKTAYYACGALGRYQMPRITSTGDISVYVDTVFENVVTLKNRSSDAWTNAPMKLMVYYD